MSKMPELIGEAILLKDKEILRLRAENEKLRERLEKAHSFISRADWMLFFEEEHAAATALKETGDES